MDSVALLSLPGFLVCVVLTAVGAWIGHTIGRNNENKRKVLALAEAERATKESLESLRDENQKKLDVLNKANSNDMDALKQAHSAQIDQLNGAHQNLVDSLKSGYSGEIARLESEHSGLIDRLNSSNNANISEMENRRQQEIETLRGEQQTTVDTLRADHAEALSRLNEDRDRRLQEAEQRGAEEKARLNELLAETRAERDGLAAKGAELETALAGLRDEIKEGKLNNMFSVSKSGEKLIRVVRSVQELASELDETSRTVTGGDYSFFDQIKDQRDRETVLSLATGGQTVAGDEGAETEAGTHQGNGADDSVPPATDSAVSGAEERPAD